jgi:hypothetical protein
LTYIGSFLPFNKDFLDKFTKDIATGSSLQPILGNRGPGHIADQLTQIASIFTPHPARRVQTETCQGYALGSLEFHDTPPSL